MPQEPDPTHFLHILDAKDRARIVAQLAEDRPCRLLFRTSGSWQALETPDDPDTVAIAVQTPIGIVGLEFHKNEVRALAKHILDVTSDPPSSKRS